VIDVARRAVNRVGDIPGAITLFRDLLQDQIRTLGPEPHHTLRKRGTTFAVQFTSVAPFYVGGLTTFEGYPL
jgi:hypothetical protein